MKSLILTTNEEKNMLTEDLNGHLMQRAEYIGKQEELEVLLQQVNENTSPEYFIYIKYLADRKQSK